MLRVRNYPRESGIPPAALLQLTNPVLGFDQAQMELSMACKKCASNAQQDFASELSVVFPGIQGLNLSPIYISQHILVCLECGFTELVIAGSKLNQLRDGLAASRSRSAS
jgi:predicted nucleic-acid-binding Zn-ribbon protein